MAKSDDRNECKWSREKTIGAMEYCLKLRAEGDAEYCPKRRVLVDGAQGEIDRRMKKLRASRELKKQLRESLKDSPLRGYNPKFDKVSNTYSR